MTRIKALKVLSVLFVKATKAIFLCAYFNNEQGMKELFAYYKTIDTQK